MSNYTNENLIIATAKTGERAIKIGDKIFVGLDLSGGTTDFYKCASVSSSSTSKTWTGYKAIQNQVTHVYSFEPSITSGLTYTVITPQEGKVYADGALIQANLWSGIPTSGLVFYAPLSASSATAETGQTLTEIDGSPTYSTVQGIQCAQFDGNCYLRFSDSGLPYPNGFSVCLWAKGNIQDQQRCCISWGTNQANQSFGVMLAPNGTMKTIGAKNENNEWTSNQGDISISNWNFICVVNRGTTEDIYINGTKIGTFTWTRSITTGGYGYIGAMTDMDWLLIGYLAGIRIYNRQLTDPEISSLANEFTPSIS